MAEIKDVKPRPGDVLANLSETLYREAYDNKRSLTAHLNLMFPQADYGNDGLDGFQRLLEVADIACNSDQVQGYWADDFDKFLTSPQTRALVPEWMARQCRKVKAGPALAAGKTRDIGYQSTDYALNTYMRPYTDDAVIRWDTIIAPAIPLSEVVALSTPIVGDAYRAFYLDNGNASDNRMYRIAEGTDIPRAKLSGGTRTIQLHKYGRAIESTYEALRRMPIDFVALHVQQMQVQAEIDKFVACMGIIVNGDGNSGTAATSYTQTSLGGSAAAALTLPVFMAFRMKFQNPYFATSMVTQEDVALEIMLLNTGTGNQALGVLPQGFIGAIQPINPGLATPLRLGWTSDAPADKIVAFDRRTAVHHLTEIGADISEVGNFISNQTQLLTLTEVEGFRIFDGNSSKILDLAS